MDVPVLLDLLREPWMPNTKESRMALERVLDRLKWLVKYGVEINLRKDEAEVLLEALERPQ
jgi:hypothetical protein